MSASPLIKLRSMMLSLLALFVSMDCTSRNSPARLEVYPFEKWGLPPGLCDGNASLRQLRLPRGVEDLNWLYRCTDLQDLDASRTAVKELEGLPRGLKKLDISYTEIRELSSLPPGLTQLNISMTNVVSLDGLPDGLVELVIGGKEASGFSLSYLPSSLRRLVVNNANLRSLDSLPGDLRVLELVNCRVDTLRDLPASLTKLVVTGSNIDNLVKFPQNIKTLVWADNPDLQVSRFPPYLVGLRVDNIDSPALAGLRYLEFVDLSRTRLSGPLVLPNFVKELSLRSDDLETIAIFPETLRTLSLVKANSDHLGRLPGTLRSLRLLNSTGYSLSVPSSVKSLQVHSSDFEVSDLPAGMEHFSINAADLGQLARLPERLRVLELRWLELSKLPPLPSGLKVLDLEGSSNIVDLNGLPGLLECLDISNTGIRRLGRLPNSLRALDISGTEISDLSMLHGGLERLVISTGQLGFMVPGLRDVKSLAIIDFPAEDVQCGIEIN